MKTCSTCRYYGPLGSCHAPAASEIDRVMGVVYPSARAVAEGPLCGPEAKLWRPVPLGRRGAVMFGASVIVLTFVAFGMLLVFAATRLCS